VGSLSLGGPVVVNESFAQGGTLPLINTSVVAGWLWDEFAENLRVPSNSFGLHIRSVAPKIGPSLYCGGFDQNRVIGPMFAQLVNIYRSVDLLDVQINAILVRLLEAPQYSRTSDQRQLLNWIRNTSIDPLAVYLDLPKSTCDAIAAQLPVTFQAKYGLSFWNTQGPLYHKIVSSASSMSFIFRQNESNTQNITINVPFMLLNLTLQAPLTQNSIHYFPCKPSINLSLATQSPKPPFLEPTGMPIISKLYGSLLKLRDQGSLPIHKLSRFRIRILLFRLRRMIGLLAGEIIGRH